MTPSPVYWSGLSLLLAACGLAEMSNQGDVLLDCNAGDGPVIALAAPLLAREVSGPLKLLGSATREDGLAVTDVRVLGRKVTPTLVGFRSWEIELSQADLESAANPEGQVLLSIEAWDICGDHAVYACPERDGAGQEDPLCRTVILVSAVPEAPEDSGGEDTGTAG